MFDITNIKDKVIKKINSTEHLKILEELKIEYLGKKGIITESLKNLKDIEPDKRKEFGMNINKLKQEIIELINKKESELTTIKINKELEKESDFDTSIPIIEYPIGSLNPITLVQKEIEEIFTSMGFIIADGPEADSDYNNFKSLNIPEHHPARDMQDTYYLENGYVLRTQTSSMQNRIMKNFKPPVRAIMPGRCFRNEALDASHENTFFQLEGIMIDENISIANLTYTMKLMLIKIFKQDVTVRLRPGFFPFVEPGFELDLNCLICHGKGCSTCKNSGWIELLPCGMIHPNVLIEGGIDPEKYTGFAFGLGLTRLAMMKYQINDIRIMNSGNIKALNQIGV